jgi:hypothetical protein
LYRVWAVDAERVEAITVRYDSTSCCGIAAGQVRLVLGRPAAKLGWPLVELLPNGVRRPVGGP